VKYRIKVRVGDPRGTECKYSLNLKAGKTVTLKKAFTGIPFDHESVGDLACTLSVEEGALRVGNVQETEQVTLNGKPISLETIHRGDVLTFGRYTIEFLQLPEVKAADPAAKTKFIDVNEGEGGATIAAMMPEKGAEESLVPIAAAEQPIPSVPPPAQQEPAPAPAFVPDAMPPAGTVEPEHLQKSFEEASLVALASHSQTQTQTRMAMREVTPAPVAMSSPAPAPAPAPEPAPAPVTHEGSLVAMTAPHPRPPAETAEELVDREEAHEEHRSPVQRFIQQYKHYAPHAGAAAAVLLVAIFVVAKRGGGAPDTASTEPQAVAVAEPQTPPPPVEAPAPPAPDPQMAELLTQQRMLMEQHQQARMAQAQVSEPATAPPQEIAPEPEPEPVVARRADPPPRDKPGKSSPANELVKAAGKGSLSAVRSLLASKKHKLKPDARDAAGRTALMAAAENGKIDVVRFLIQKKASVNVRDKKKMTALMYAVMKKRKETVATLLKAKADPKMKNANGKSSIDLARVTKDKGLLALLDKKGASRSIASTPSKKSSKKSAKTK
jgi:hypothetical protein